MNKLNNAELKVLFSYLSFEDRKNVRLSCRRFRKVCGSSEFSQFETLVIRPCYPIETVGHTLKQSTSEILRLDLRHMSVLPSETMWASISDKLRTLSLSQCRISPAMIVDIVDKCRQLKYLELFRINSARPQAVRNIELLMNAFETLKQLDIKRENLEVLQIDVRTRGERFLPNFLDEYILNIFPKIRAVCITHVWRFDSTWLSPVNGPAQLTYSFSANGPQCMDCGWSGHTLPVPILLSPEGFRRLIMVQKEHSLFSFFVREELRESIHSSVIRQRANTNIDFFYLNCPALCQYFSDFGFFGNLRFNYQQGSLRFQTRDDQMVFSRREFLTVLNSYLHSQNLGLFYLHDDDLRFHRIQLPVERNSPTLSINNDINIPDYELCGSLLRFQNLRQLELLNVSANVLKAVFLFHRELLCLRVRLISEFSSCEYNIDIIENWIRNHARPDPYFRQPSSIGNLTHLQCLCLDYSLISANVVFSRDTLNEFILPNLRHFNIYGRNQPFLWKAAQVVAANAPKLELLELSGGCSFNVLKTICSLSKKLFYLRCDSVANRRTFRINFTRCRILFELSENLRVISQNDYHYYFNPFTGSLSYRIFAPPPHMELRKCPFAPSMHMEEEKTFQKEDQILCEP